METCRFYIGGNPGRAELGSVAMQCQVDLIDGRWCAWSTEPGLEYPTTRDDKVEAVCDHFKARMGRSEDE